MQLGMWPQLSSCSCVLGGMPRVAGVLRGPIVPPCLCFALCFPMLLPTRHASRVGGPQRDPAGTAAPLGTRCQRTLEAACGGLLGTGP